MQSSLDLVDFVVLPSQNFQKGKIRCTEILLCECQRNWIDARGQAAYGSGKQL